jgi:hypothetical protein
MRRRVPRSELLTATCAAGVLGATAASPGGRRLTWAGPDRRCPGCSPGDRLPTARRGSPVPPRGPTPVPARRRVTTRRWGEPRQQVRRFPPVAGRSRSLSREAVNASTLARGMTVTTAVSHTLSLRFDIRSLWVRTSNLFDSEIEVFPFERRTGWSERRRTGERTRRRSSGRGINPVTGRCELSRGRALRAASQQREQRTPMMAPRTRWPTSGRTTLESPHAYNPGGRMGAR